MYKFIFSFIFFLFFTACSTKIPVTWKERVLGESKVKVSLVYDEYGEENNQTLVFLHGFGENRHTWRFLISELSKHYHLILLDLKGFGNSPKTKDVYYSVYDQAKEVTAFMKNKNLNNVTLIGRSFGGGVALVLALMQHDKLIESRIKRLVLINSMAYKQRLPSMLRLLNRPIIGYLGIHLLSNEYLAKEGYKYAFYNNDLIPRLSILYTSEFMDLPLAKYAYLQTAEQLIPDDIYRMQQRYKEIKLPTLIMWGKADVSIGVWVAYRLHRDLSNSTLKVFPHLGHMPQEESPQLVISELIKFIGK